MAAAKQHADMFTEESVIPETKKADLDLNGAVVWPTVKKTRLFWLPEYSQNNSLLGDHAEYSHNNSLLGDYAGKPTFWRCLNA